MPGRERELGWGVLVVALAGLGACLHPSPLAAQERRGVTAEQVRTAIERASRFLIREQKADGSWQERREYADGLSPLCTLALLHAGQAIEEEPIARAMERLRRLVPTATYTAAVQTMAFCRGNPGRDLPLIARNVKWLESRQIRTGDQAGMWAIPENGTPDHVDNSMTHMALLALYDAERVGVRASDETWRLALDYWRRSQNADGSWGWGPDWPGTGSMTCAGIASIIVAKAHFEAGDARVENGVVLCCQTPAADPQLERAQAWLARNFSVNRNPGMRFWHSYYLFALERVGRITGQRFIGAHDWYREAAETLVTMQLPTGSWPSDMDEEYHADPLVATSFSLLFLAKARRPLVVGHVQHGEGDDWRRHREGLANVIAHVERLWDRELAYQTVDLAVASVEDLLETPVLYLSGRDALALSAADKKKLRMYVDRGGFLFADQSCAGGPFDASFRDLMTELLPEPESRLRLLQPPDHPVWRAEQEVDPAHARPLWGVDVSCRTAVIYCPLDLSCRWELAGAGPLNAYPADILAEVEAALAMGANVLSYATNREVKFKDPLTPVAESSEDGPEFERGKTYVANLLHPGGCRGAPGALWTVLRLADEQLRMSIGTTPREVALTDPDLYQYNLLFMHGRTAFELTPAERSHLRTYLERGGAVLADAICSSTEFAESLRRELALAVPEASLSPIAIDDPLLSEQFGYNLRTVSRRGVDGEVESGPPVLECLRLNGRIALVFSPHDLSCALESREPVECGGYVREDAARIVINALHYLLQ
jgi:hypothetical protein